MLQVSSGIGNNSFSCVVETTSLFRVLVFELVLILDFVQNFEIKKSKAMKVTKQANSTRLHVEFMDLTKWKLSL